ncbi:glycosyltransferase family 2 protein [Prolixibacter denitrificans]|uniref:Glycosyl transferase n=1 Tax=Prolixibacter denitrificans TaxID=1541063 RepID=A0A2P8CFR2_9BACT|nr:glycosyltransferase family 2 protein [Prolixibacter denitrificans]PSK83823.1 glycosyltransferase involved in cell wall biosynthesis [Prolixibacter denitrificans]GET23365.1 glycosyl transferase [Prolixibacter denitrificans]
MEKISVVVTVFNEEDNIRPLVEQITAALTDYPFEIVYVDDGSTDNTVQVIKSMNNPHLKLVELKKNFGQCPALKAGIDYATGDFIVTMDGDLQNDPSDIPMMVERAKEGDFDLVAGIREKRKDGFILRKLPSKLANWLIRRVTKVDIKDNGCALKVFRADMAKSIPLYGELHRFISVLAHYEGAKIDQVNVKHHARIHGQSKYGLSRTFRVLSDLILMLFFRKYMQKPMHFFGTFGILTGMAGGAILFYFFILKLMGENIWGRPLLLLGIILLFIGFQIITLGLLLDYQMRTYYESQHKAPYKVRRVTGGEEAN